MSNTFVDLKSISGKNYVTSLLLRRVVVFWWGTWLGITLGVWAFGKFPIPWLPIAFLALLPSVILGGAGGVAFALASFRLENVALRNQRAKAEANRSDQPQEFALSDAEYGSFNDRMSRPFAGLTIGVATGHLEKRGHVGGVESGQSIFLRTEDCCKNLIIFGGIGSGKTTRAINPLLYQVLMQDSGVLIFDIKGDFGNEVAYLSKAAERSFSVIGDGGYTVNLIRGTSPELASSFLKSCFIMSGQGAGDNAFWANGATELCRHCLTLIQTMGGEYSLAGLYELVFDPARRDEMIRFGLDNLEDFGERDRRLFKATATWFVSIFNEHEEKVRKNIMSTAADVLGPFAHPDMVDAFSRSDTDTEADLADLINNRAVFLVSLPAHKYGREGTRYAYMLLKLRFFNLMRERRTRVADWDQKRPVIFFCDEYQSIVDTISDTDFWDKSRSSGCAGIVSMQGYSSLVQALGGKDKAASAILQNFRQRLVFRTEDEGTIRHVQHLLGQVDVHLESVSSSSSETSTGQHGDTSSTSVSENFSTAIQRQDLFGPNDFRSMSADFALYIGNVGDWSVDEVVRMSPLYLPR